MFTFLVPTSVRARSLRKLFVTLVTAMALLMSALGGSVPAHAATGTEQALADYPIGGLTMVHSSDGTTAAAIWVREDTSTFQNVVEARVGTLSGTTFTWSTPQVLSDSRKYAFDPTIAISADGSVIVAAWRWNDASNSIVVQSRLASVTDGDVTWSQTTTSLSASGSNAEAPRVGLSADGRRAILVWSRAVNFIKGVQAATTYITPPTADTPISASWSASPQILTSGAPTVQSYDVAIAKDGSRAVVVWNRGDYPTVKAHAAVATFGASSVSWSASQDVFNVEDTSSSDISVRLSSNGAMVALAWKYVAVDGIYMQAAIGAVAANGGITWDSIQPLRMANSGNTGDLPKIEISANGEQLVAMWWSQFSGGYSYMFAAGRISSGVATWSAATEVASQTAADFDLSLAADGKSAILIGSVASRIYLWRATLSGTAFAIGNQQVLSQPNRISNNPQVHATADGSTVITTWLSYDGTSTTPRTLVVIPDFSRPVITGPESVTVPASETVVGTFTANESVNWSLDEAFGDYGKFDIDSSGLLTFVDPAVNGSYTVNVRSTDADANRSSLKISITVESPKPVEPMIAQSAPRIVGVVQPGNTVTCIAPMFSKTVDSVSFLFGDSAALLVDKAPWQTTYAIPASMAGSTLRCEVVAYGAGATGTIAVNMPVQPLTVQQKSPTRCAPVALAWSGTNTFLSSSAKTRLARLTSSTQCTGGITVTSYVPKSASKAITAVNVQRVAKVTAGLGVASVRTKTVQGVQGCPTAARNGCVLVTRAARSGS